MIIVVLPMVSEGIGIHSRHSKTKFSVERRFAQERHGFRDKDRKQRTRERGRDIHIGEGCGKGNKRLPLDREKTDVARRQMVYKDKAVSPLLG